MKLNTRCYIVERLQPFLVSTDKRRNAAVREGFPRYGWNLAHVSVLCYFKGAPGQQRRLGTDHAMFIGSWLRLLREEKGLSQADIEKSTGLLRGYISRVENGRTVPSLETLERLAAALEIPLYRLFFMNEEPFDVARNKGTRNDRSGSEQVAHGDQFLARLRQLCGKMSDSQRELVLGVARRLAERHKGF